MRENIFRWVDIEFFEIVKTPAPNEASYIAILKHKQPGGCKKRALPSKVG